MNVWTITTLIGFGGMIYILYIIKDGLPKKLAREKEKNRMKWEAELKSKQKKQVHQQENLYNTINKQDHKQYLQVSEITKHFRLPAGKLNQIFTELNWVYKSEKWWVATDLGIKNGAEQRYNTQTKQKYVVWNNNILHNQELINAINNPQINKPKHILDREKEHKGNQYEMYISKYFEKQGYKIKRNGLLYGKIDKGVDLIIMKNREITLVQCKNWKEKGKKIRHNDLKEFLGNTTTFLENNKDKAEGYTIKRLYITSNDILDYSAKKFLEENKNTLEYQIIPITA